MSRLGFGLGFGLNNITTLGGATEIFSANGITLNQSTQYLQAPDATKGNIGSTKFSMTALIKNDGQTLIYGKGSGGLNDWVGWDNNLASEMVLRLSSPSGQVFFKRPNTFIPNDGEFHRVTIFYSRINDSTLPTIYMDDQASETMNSSASGSGWASHDFTSTNSMTIGALFNDGTSYKLAPPSFGLCVDTELTEADHLNLWNADQAQCFDLIPSETKDKFTTHFDLATWTGHAEVEALKDNVAGWSLNNVNSAPFNTPIQIECEA